MGKNLKTNGSKKRNSIIGEAGTARVLVEGLFQKGTESRRALKLEKIEN